MQPYTGYSQFFMMCDAIEGANGTAAPGPDGVGLPAALNTLPNGGFLTWLQAVAKALWLQGCSDKNVSDWKDPSSVGCWDTYNATSTAYTDWSSTNPFGRTWSWLLCNEPLQGWTTAPKDGPTIVSRFGTAEYNRRQCGLFFPTEGQNTYGLNSGKTAADVNSKYDGWLFTNTTRMVWTNGELDPLLDATVSSEIRPGGPLQSSAGVQVYLIPGAHHATDLFMKNGDLNADIKTAITGVVSNLTTWVNEFYDAKKPAASGQA